MIGWITRRGGSRPIFGLVGDLDKKFDENLDETGEKVHIENPSRLLAAIGRCV